MSDFGRLSRREAPAGCRSARLKAPLDPCRSGDQSTSTECSVRGSSYPSFSERSRRDATPRRSASINRLFDSSCPGALPATPVRGWSDGSHAEHDHNPTRPDPARPPCDDGASGHQTCDGDAVARVTADSRRHRSLSDGKGHPVVLLRSSRFSSCRDRRHPSSSEFKIHARFVPALCAVAATSLFVHNTLVVLVTQMLHMSRRRPSSAFRPFVRLKWARIRRYSPYNFFTLTFKISLSFTSMQNELARWICPC